MEERGATGGIVDYFGRDVKPGGSLVVQSDWLFGDQLEYDQIGWELIASIMLNDDCGRAETVMVTGLMYGRHALSVFRRRA
jgi:hypothetical protein